MAKMPTYIIIFNEFVTAYKNSGKQEEMARNVIILRDSEIPENDKLTMQLNLISLLVAGELPPDADRTEASDLRIGIEKIKWLKALIRILAPVNTADAPPADAANTSPVQDTQPGKE